MGQLRLRVGGMRCRHCVRQVTAWLRDVPGVETVAADASSGVVVLHGSMDAADVLAAVAGADYRVEVVAPEQPPTAS